VCARARARLIKNKRKIENDEMNLENNNKITKKRRRWSRQWKEYKKRVGKKYIQKTRVGCARARMRVTRERKREDVTR